MNALPKKKREKKEKKKKVQVRSSPTQKEALLKKGTLKKLCKEGEGKEGRKVK